MQTVKFCLEDPLIYLPRKPLQQFARRKSFHDAARPCNNLYFVIQARVKITITARDSMTKTSRVIQSAPPPRKNYRATVREAFFLSFGGGLLVYFPVQNDVFSRRHYRTWLSGVVFAAWAN